MSRSRIAFLVAWGLLATGSVVQFVQSTAAGAEDPAEPLPASQPADGATAATALATTGRAGFDDPAIWAGAASWSSTPPAPMTSSRRSVRP